MALANFSLPFGALAQPWGATLAPLHPIHQLASNTNNLLYSPADHQQSQAPSDAAPPNSDYYKNNPYGTPALHQQQDPQPGYPYGGSRRKQGSAYLPPTGGGAARNSVYHIQQQQTQQSQQHTQQTQVDGNENTVSFHSSSASSSGQSQSTLHLTQSAGRGPAEGSYTRYPGQAPPPPTALKQQKQYYNAHGTASASATFTKNSGSYSITGYGSRQAPHPQQQQQPQPQQPQLPHQQQQPPPPPPPPQASSQSQRGRQQGGSKTETPASTYGVAPPDNYPERAPGFTRVQAGQGSRTQVHAVLDYDVEEGEEEDEDDDGEYYEADGHNQGK